MALLDIAELSVEFGTLRAVDGLNLTVEKGEVVGVVGESGSGKSVTALAIMGLVPYPGRGAAGPRSLARPHHLGRHLLE
ncbi:MAG: ATP-binding cassette domain-containing protein, partial [Alphaproteobacteria bacterium]